MKSHLTELQNVRIQLIILAGLSLLVTTAPLPARADKNKPPPGTNAPPPPPATNPPPIGTFTATGNMNVPRFGHQTVLLDNGQVLAVTGDAAANAAELYNPATGTWELTGTPNSFHERGSVTLLANGQVLLAGGSSQTYGVGFTAAAELYDPKSGQWIPTGSMTVARELQAAVLLPDGQVLVAGGQDSIYDSIAEAELYNPATGTWQATASMHQSRYSPVAELLGDGTVLVAGGITPTTDTNGSILYLRNTSAEIYNPSTGQWTSAADMPTNPAKASRLGALLPNGDVLVTLDAFFNPETGTWTPTGSSFRGSAAIGAGPSTATLLTTGDVLLTGFESTYNAAPPVNTTVLYNFSSNSYPLGASMTSVRAENAATLLPNGQVLVCGGFRYQPGVGHIALSSAELFTP